MSKKEKRERLKEINMLIRQKHKELESLEEEKNFLLNNNDLKYSLREACDEIKKDVENSPKWLRDIYEQNKKIRKQIEPPYLGDPVWESQHEMSINLLNIKD